MVPCPVGRLLLHRILRARQNGFCNGARLCQVVPCIAAGLVPRGDRLQPVFGLRPPQEPTKVVQERPPEPVPALCIAGPSVAATTVSAPKEPDGTVLPPLIPAVAKSNPVEEEPVKEVASPLQLLYTQAAERYEKMPCYMVRMRRREVVGNQQKPEEILECKFRQEPYSLHFKWIGAEAKHREVVYVKGSKGNLIHTLTAAGDILLLPGGKHFPVPADSPLVLSKSRYPITEAAVGAWIVKYGRLVDGIDKKSPQAGMAKVLGTLKRPEFEDEVIAVQHRIPPGWEVASCCAAVSGSGSSTPTTTCPS